MKHATALQLSVLFALSAAASDARAQGPASSWAAEDVQGDAYAMVYGYDYDFDGGEQDAATSTALVGPWLGEATVDLFDYYGVPVGQSEGRADTSIDATSILVELTSSASTTGNLFASDALARSTFDVDFTLALPQRYVFATSADAPVGYNLANASLNGPWGTLFDLDADYGGTDQAADTGWIPQGSYALRSQCEVQVGGAQAAEARVSVELRLLAPGDFEGDLDVDTDDLFAYVDAILAGDLATDVDSDGALTLLDFQLFVYLWQLGG